MKFFWIPTYAFSIGFPTVATAALWSLNQFAYLVQFPWYHHSFALCVPPPCCDVSETLSRCWFKDDADTVSIVLFWAWIGGAIWVVIIAISITLYKMISVLLNYYSFATTFSLTFN